MDRAGEGYERLRKLAGRAENGSVTIDRFDLYWLLVDLDEARERARLYAGHVSADVYAREALERSKSRWAKCFRVVE